MVLRRLLGYLNNRRKQVVLAMVLLLLATAADISGPFLIRTFIDHYLVRNIVDTHAFLFLALLYLVLQIGGVILAYNQQLFFYRIALVSIQTIRTQVFAKVQRLRLSFFDQVPSGALVSRMTNDTEAIKELFVYVLAIYVQNMVLVIGILTSLFFLDGQLALYTVLLFPLFLLVMFIYRKYSGQVYRLTRERLGRINAQLSESIQGFWPIQIFGQEKRFYQQFYQSNEAHYQANLQNTRLNALLLRPAIDLIYLYSLIGVLAFFGLKGAGSVQIGILYAYLSLLRRMFEPVNQMMQQLSSFQQSVVSAQRVFELYDNENVEPQDKGVGPVITQGQIKFDHVNFSYDPKNPVLHDLSFSVEPGQLVALVGPTGSGKSTIIHLLMRFYQATSGIIAIDGRPISLYHAEELRKKVGFVLQDPFLFAGTIKENISFFDPQLSDDRLIEAAKLVQADGFIRRLPQGYHTLLGEKGASLSSGERQLLSFARTMVQNPQIILLDEATSSVDTDTEIKIQHALQQIRHGRTVIAIAHRLSTIQDADQILVLNKGRIIDRGAHNELIAREGLYKRMYQHHTWKNMKI